MNLRQLEYLLAISETQSISQAAQRLGVAQPALGQQIRKLEQELDTLLLRRHSRGVETTDAGALLVTHAREILSHVQKAAAETKQYAKVPRGKVRVGITPVISALLATKIIRHVSKTAPELELGLVEEMSAVLTEWVAADRLNLALVFNVPQTQGIRWEPILHEALYFVESPEGGKENGGTITLAEVCRNRMVLPTEPHSIHARLQSTCEKRGLSLSIAYNVESVHMVRNLVLQNMGATVIPIGAVREDIARGDLIAKRIVEPEVVRDLYLLSSARRPLSRSENFVRTFLLTLLRDEIKESEAWHSVANRKASLEAPEQRH